MKLHAVFFVMLFGVFLHMKRLKVFFFQYCAGFLWNIFAQWSQTLMTVAAMGGLAFLYVSDWKVVVTKIPYYGGQFKVEEVKSPPPSDE